MEIHVPEGARKIIRQLTSRGYEAYIVGGCVRDMLLGREPEDWDITTSAMPLEVKGIFRRTIDTGIQHGTVTVMLDHTGYEVTTYRVDGEYRDGRHPSSVAFTPDLSQDLQRRDFTINAMAYNSQDGLVDIFGGRQDLEQKIIRCVGDPVERFTEDALRMLRAVRFSAQLGFEIEEHTWEAVRQMAPNLAKVSRERVQTELTKLLVSASPDRIRLVYQAGMAPYVSPAFEQAGTQWEIPPISSELPAKKALRWAAFFRRVPPELAVQALKELKLDNDTIYQVRTLTREVKVPFKSDKPAIRRVMSQMEPGLFDDLLTLKESVAPNERQETGEELAQVRLLAEQIRRDGDCLSLKDLAVKGKDLMEAGVLPGRPVGENLEYLLSLVLEDPSRNNREYLLRHLKV